MTLGYSPVRVQRLSDGKIFTNSQAAAKAYRKPIAKTIEASCNGYIGFVEGSMWSWNYEPILYPDTGDYSEIVYRASKLLPPRKKSVYVNRYRVVGKAKDPKYRDVMLPIVKFFRSFATEVSTLRVPSVFAHERFMKWARLNSENATITNPASFGRHLKSWEILYQRLVGLEISYGVDDRSRKAQLLSFDLELIDPFASIYDEIEEYSTEELPEKSESSKRLLNFATAIPIYCHNNRMHYPSIREASRSTLVPEDDIKYICNKDYPFLKVGNIKWKFSYSKWEKVSEKWLIGEGSGNSRNSPIPVINLLTGETYRSISEAHRKTGVPKAKIKQSMESPEGSNVIRINSVFTGENEFAFGKYDEELDW